MKSIQAYFDGTAVRPLENYNFKMNQRVFINIPSDSESKRIEEQLKAVDDLFNLLNEEETKEFSENMENRLLLKEAEI